ncbi:TQXA domain-containing protein [Solihabitans fulvus]|uniref:TQXA domain-containing protein n=1 Tax=Solihabitans fulvus TaxID=1892852 RepID=A0A5B2XFS5_9PSEU|nr:thioester domain-containing protein [Solihabitans fulvus]KAA2262183.1 TQXA domain-containing protein [Solihabitans fulvus]
MASRFTPARVGAAILGASVALLAAALPAAADGTHAKLDGNYDESGYQVQLLKAGSEKNPTASLIGIKIDGTDKGTQTYCVELPQSTQLGYGMDEVPWEKYPSDDSGFKKNSGKINWILHNSYPSVKPDALGKTVGVDLSAKEAITATQAAIWHFSDNVDLDTANPLVGNEDSAKDVVKLYDFLVSKAVDLDQPTPSLAVDPKEKAGKAGDLIGPFTVTSTADKVTFSAMLPAGVTLTDKDGKELDKPADKKFAAKVDAPKTADFFVKVPADAKPGEADISIHADAQLDKGRLFIRSSVDKKTQSLIVASPVTVPLDITAHAKWDVAASTTTPTTSAPTTTDTTPVVAAASNEAPLANTGASIFWPIAIGVVLLVAGGGALFMVRRKKNTA